MYEDSWFEHILLFDGENKEIKLKYKFWKQRTLFLIYVWIPFIYIKTVN